MGLVGLGWTLLHGVYSAVAHSGPNLLLSVLIPGLVYKDVQALAGEAGREKMRHSGLLLPEGGESCSSAGSGLGDAQHCLLGAHLAVPPVIPRCGFRAAGLASAARSDGHLQCPAGTFSFPTLGMLQDPPSFWATLGFW